jgi:hypothetical protein
MNATVKDALVIARSLLMDDIGSIWTDAVLFPKVKQAHQELVAKLNLNGIAVQIQTTVRITIPIGQLNMGVTGPTDIIRVIEIHELATGDPIENAIRMTKQDFMPYVPQDTTLRYWTYNLEQVQFLGATTSRDIIMHYLRQPAPPIEVNSTLDFDMSEIYIGPRVAALSVATKDPNLFSMTNQIAEENLSLLVRTQVKGDQSLPVRRRPFSYMRRRGYHTRFT